MSKLTDEQVENFFSSVGLADEFKSFKKDLDQMCNQKKKSNADMYPYDYDSMVWNGEKMYSKSEIEYGKRMRKAFDVNAKGFKAK